jgi:hypothetical protein
MALGKASPRLGTRARGCACRRAAPLAAPLAARDSCSLDSVAEATGY